MLQQLPEYALVGLVTFGSMVHGEASPLTLTLAATVPELDRICSADAEHVSVAVFQ